MTALKMYIILENVVALFFYACIITCVTYLAVAFVVTEATKQPSDGVLNDEQIK